MNANDGSLVAGSWEVRENCSPIPIYELFKSETWEYFDLFPDPFPPVGKIRNFYHVRTRRASLIITG